MDISATYVFDAPAQKVWDTLMDPQALAACVPGCQSLEPTGDNEYQAVVNISLGPVRGNFTAKVAITETNPYQSYRLSLSGNSNIGFGSGDSLVTLEEDGGKTTVRVDDPRPGRWHRGPGGPAHDGKCGAGNVGPVLFVFAGDGSERVGESMWFPFKQWIKPSTLYSGLASFQQRSNTMPQPFELTVTDASNLIRQS